MSWISLIETIINASPSAAVFIIAVLALLVVWQALSVLAHGFRRDRGDD